MGKVKDIYIPYLNTGYSGNTVQGLLCDMKIYRLEDHEKIRQKALEILTTQNGEILERNFNRHFVVKVIDTVLWALSFGFIRLLEREIKIGPLMATANKIQDYVLNTPLINQKDRSDYSEACEIIRLEEEAKQKEIEELEQELLEKEKAHQAAIDKLKQEFPDADDKEILDDTGSLENLDDTEGLRAALGEEEFQEQMAALKKFEEQAKLTEKPKPEEQAKLKEKPKPEEPAKPETELTEEEKQEAAKKAQLQKEKQAALRREVQQREEEAKKIRKSIKEKSKTAEQKKIKSLKAQWSDDVFAEHQRLKAKGLIPQTQKADVQVLLGYGSNLENQFDVIVGRIREIKEHYSNTHYVFTHGMGKGLAVINECMQRLLENFTPSLHNPLSMPFRLPHTVDLTENVTAFFKKYPNVADDSFNDDELNKKTGELLSVDPYIRNIAIYESALFFFVKGTNINMGADPNIGENIFRDIFINYLEDNYLCNIVAKKAARIAADHSKANLMGTLWAICIPKTVVHDPKKNMAYPSHPFARRCTCYSSSEAISSEDIKVLERTQRDEVVTCKSGLHPQYRLLTARLVQEQSVRSFPVNSLKKAENKAFSKRIKNLVREIALYSAIVGLRSVPSAEESSRINEELKALCESKQINRDCLEYLLLTQRENLNVELIETIELAMAALIPEGNNAFV